MRLIFILWLLPFWVSAQIYDIEVYEDDPRSDVKIINDTMPVLKAKELPWVHDMLSKGAQIEIKRVLKREENEIQEEKLRGNYPIKKRYIRKRRIKYKKRKYVRYKGQCYFSRG